MYADEWALLYKWIIRNPCGFPYRVPVRNAQLKYKKTIALWHTLPFSSKGDSKHLASPPCSFENPVCVALLNVFANSAPTFWHAAWHLIISRPANNHFDNGILSRGPFRHYSILRGLEITCTPQLGSLELTRRR